MIIFRFLVGFLLFGWLMFMQWQSAKESAAEIILVILVLGLLTAIVAGVLILALWQSK